MPYKSAKQRRYMHARHPEIAARWDREYGGKVKKSKSKPQATKTKKKGKKAGR